MTSAASMAPRAPGPHRILAVKRDLALAACLTVGRAILKRGPKSGADDTQMRDLLRACTELALSDEKANGDGKVQP